MLKGRTVVAPIVIITVCAVLIIFLVSQHKSTNIELELTADRIDFALLNPVGTDRRIPLVSCLTASSFTLSNFAPVELRVDALYDITDTSRPLLRKKRIILKPTDQRFSRLTLTGENLTLTDLDLQPNAKVTLVVSEDGSISLWIHPDSVDSNIFPFVQGIISITNRVEASVERCVVTDENKKALLRETSQARFLVDLGSLGGNLLYRSNQTTFLSMKLFEGSRVDKGKTISIYDPTNGSWAVVPSRLPVSLPNAVTSVVDGKIYLFGGTPTLPTSNETKLLSSNLDITCLKFLKPSLEDPSKEITTVKTGTITFPNGESGEVKLKSEFVHLLEKDTFRLVSTKVENNRLCLFLVGRPKSVSVGFRQDALNQKLPTLLEWLYTNRKIYMITGILLSIIGLMVSLGRLVLDLRKGKLNGELR